MNLYENWIKKETMILILEKSKEISLFSENMNLIYMGMIQVIYQNIKKHFHLLVTDHQQHKFYEGMLDKIYNNLYYHYGIKYYKIFHYGLFYYYNMYEINDLFCLLTEYEIDDKEYLSIEVFFRGIHQIIEINLLYLMKEQDKIERLLNMDHVVVKEIIYHNVSIWGELIELLHSLLNLLVNSLSNS